MMRLSFAAAFVVASTAFAEGAVLSPSQLSRSVAERMEAELAAERQAAPSGFGAVDALHARLGALEAQKRGGLLPVALMLKPLGADAALPLMEELAFRSRGKGALPPSAWLAWRIGVLEALGNLRDARARPLYEAVLASSVEDARIARAAARALGQLNDDRAAQALVALSAEGENAVAVRAGMGTCRRAPVALALAEHLGSSRDGEEAAALIHALGEVGNAWAWQTPSVRAHAEEERSVRRVAASALVSAFVRFDGHPRQLASNALLVVDAPETGALLERAAATAPEASEALQALAARLSASPIR